MTLQPLSPRGMDALPRWSDTTVGCTVYVRCTPPQEHSAYGVPCRGKGKEREDSLRSRRRRTNRSHGHARSTHIGGVPAVLPARAWAPHAHLPPAGITSGERPGGGEPPWDRPVHGDRLIDPRRCIPRVLGTPAGSGSIMNADSSDGQAEICEQKCR